MPPQETADKLRPGFSDTILVVALTRQRPDQDADVSRAVLNSVERYGERLDRADGHDDDILRCSLLEDQPLQFYNPCVIRMWGNYDLGVFYLADDMSHVQEVAGHSGAAAQEYVFGPIYKRLEVREQNVLRSIFSDTAPPNDGTLALGCLKLGEHFLTTCGRALFRALRVWILEKAGETDLDLNCLVFPCSSWADVCVLVLDDDPAKVIRFMTIIESATLNELMSSEAAGAELKELVRYDSEDNAALRVPFPSLDLLRRWTCGRWANIEESSETTVLEHARTAHLLVTCRYHLGFPASTRPRRLNSPLYHMRQMRFLTGKALAQRRRDSPTQEDELKATCMGVEKDWGSSPTTPRRRVVAVILLHAKPGHWTACAEEAERIAGLLWKRGPADVFSSTEGELVRIALRLVDFIEEDPAAAMLRISSVSLYLRVSVRVASHLLDVTTALDFSELPKPPMRSRPAESPTPKRWGPSGLALLRSSPPPDIQAYERTLLGRIGLGVGETSAVLEWQGIVRHCSSHRDTFGAMLDLSELVWLMRTEIIEGIHLGLSEQARLASDLREWLKYGQQAYLQRVQYTPTIGGGLPLEAEIPFGVNQLVGMVGGLTRAIMGLCAPADVEHPHRDDDRVCIGNPYDWRQILVVFGPDEMFAARNISSVCCVRMNVMAATNPLVLTLLMHELGHFIEHSELHNRHIDMEGVETNTKTGFTLYDMRHEASRAICYGLQRMQPRRDRRVEHRLVHGLLSDIFAHLIWRRLGCNRDWAIFETQFLTNFAMGVRTDNRRVTPMCVLECWATALLHLEIQRGLKTAENITDDLSDLSMTGADQLQLIARRILLQLDKLSETGGAFTWVTEHRGWWSSEVWTAMCRARDRPEECGWLAKRVEVPPAVLITLIIEEHLTPLLIALSASEPEALREGFLAHASNQEPDERGLPILMRSVTEYLRTHDALMERVAALERDLEAAARDSAELLADEATLSEALFEKDGSGPQAPWGLVDAQGHPLPETFLWARSILMAFTRHFMTIRRTTADDRVVYRNPDDLTFLGTSQPVPDGPEPRWRSERVHGIYADPRGRLFALGRGPRSDLQRSQTAVLAALSGLAMRIRAGQVWRAFRRGRSLPRFELPAVFTGKLSWSLDKVKEVADVYLKDISPGGFRVTLKNPVDTLPLPESVTLTLDWPLRWRCFRVKPNALIDKRHLGLAILAIQGLDDVRLLPELPLADKHYK